MRRYQQAIQQNVFLLISLVGCMAPWLTPRLFPPSAFFGSSRLLNEPGIVPAVESNSGGAAGTADLQLQIEVSCAAESEPLRNA